MAPTIALYHHLPPGGAERAAYELVKATREDFHYILFRIDDGDMLAPKGRAALEDIVAEVRTVSAKKGADSRAGRWSASIPATVKAEREIAVLINADPSIDVLATHHQQYLQAPGLHDRVDVPTAYFVQEPRRRSFEYDLRHPEGTKSVFGTAASKLTAPLEAWAARRDIRQTRAADLLLCNSDHSREYIWRAYGRDAVVVRLGVDTDTFALRPGALPRDNEVLAIGSLDPTKGHDLAIDAVAAVSESIRPTLRLIFNRDHAPTRTALEARAAAAGVDLILSQDVTEQALVAHYQSAAAVILAGRVEPLGLTALEAMSCGTPALGVREGGYRETIIDGATGILADRNGTALGAGLQRILGGEFDGRDAELRSHVLAHHSWTAAGRTYADAITSLL